MKFSVVIPAYNIVNYLQECVESVTSQMTEYDFEIVLINDGSTDNTPLLAQELKDKHPHLIQLVNKENGGLSSARNAGVRVAKGEYIIFLDGDDFWSENTFLQSIGNILNKKNYDIILFSYSHFYNEDNVKSFLLDDSCLSGNVKEDSVSLISNRIFNSPAWNKCIKRELIFENDLFFPEGVLSEDCLWSAKLLNSIDSYYVFNNNQHRYRQNRIGSITNIIKEKNVLDILDSIDKGLTEIPKDNGNLALATNIYFLISYLSVFPSAYKYRGNKRITDLLSKYKHLLSFKAFLKKDRNFYLRAVLASYLGIKLSSFLLGKMKIFVNLLKKVKQGK